MYSRVKVSEDENSYRVISIKSIYYMIDCSNEMGSPYRLSFMEDRGHPYLIFLKDTSYIFDTYEMRWYCKQAHKIRRYVSFEEVLENTPREIAGELLFYIETFTKDE